MVVVNFIFPEFGEGNHVAETEKDVPFGRLAMFLMDVSFTSFTKGEGF